MAKGEELIAMALARRAAAEKRLRDLEEMIEGLRQEMEQVSKQVADWNTFVHLAGSLDPSGGVAAAGVDTSSDEPELFPRRSPTLKRDSWAAKCARLILNRGPLSMRELKDELAADAEKAEVSEFRTTLSSAIARRNDIFERGEDGRMRLRVREIDFVD